MSAITLAYIRLRWLHVPAAILMVLLQRVPVLRSVITAEFAVSSGVSSVLKGVLAGSAALGAVHSVAGATALNSGDTGNPASGTVGESFAAVVAVTGAPANPASYQVTGQIPPGLDIAGMAGDTVNNPTLAFTGTPTEAGEFTMKIRAWKGLNKSGQGGDQEFDYVINVSAADGTAPTISTQPSSITVTAGGSASFSVAASGEPAPTFQWRKDGADIGGATAATLNLTSVSSNDAGVYTVVVANASGNVTSSGATLTVGAPAEVTVTTQPASINPVDGGTATLSVAASSSESITYEWFRFRAGAGLSPVAGANSSTLVIRPVSANDMGFYFARITSGGTTVDSDYAVLTVQGGTSRLANLSTRGLIPAGQNLTPGFVLRGDGSKDLIIRAVGPELLTFGLTTFLDDPTLGLIPLGGNTPILTNDNWEDSSNSAALATRSSELGAFPLTAGSLDASVLTSVALPNANGNAGHTVQISSTTGTAGIAIAEVYDPDDFGTGAQLTNISARGFSGLDGEALIPGFVIDGTGAKTMLIRVGGPLLASFSVPNTMPNPKLEVIPSGQTFVIASNDDWGGTAELKAAFNSTGAFPFDSDSSLDAAVLVRLPPGGYTVRVTDANDEVGEVIVEAYEVLD